MSEREPYDEKLPLHEGWTPHPSDERARLPLTGEKRAWLQVRAHNTGQILHGHPGDEQLWADLSEGVMSLLTEWKSEHAARLEAEARVERLEAPCKHEVWQMLAREDDSEVGGTGVLWSPICRQCGADVPFTASGAALETGEPHG